MKFTEPGGYEERSRRNQILAALIEFESMQNVHRALPMDLWERFHLKPSEFCEAITALASRIEEDAYEDQNLESPIYPPVTFAEIAEVLAQPLSAVFELPYYEGLANGGRA